MQRNRLIEEKFFEETIARLAREKNCSAKIIRTQLSKIYRRSGKFFHRGKLTAVFKCALVLKERFPNGYKIGDKIFYSRFLRYLQEIFDEKAPLTQQTLDSLINKMGIPCDCGKYIHPDCVHVPSTVIERVKNFIDSADHAVISYKEIFAALKDVFVGTQITNHYFLHGAIKFYKLPYALHKNYLIKPNGIDMAKEFNNFVVERGEVSLREIKEKFISLTDTNIKALIKRCPEVIRTDSGSFVHASHLNLHAEDFEPIKKFLRRNCATPVNVRACRRNLSTTTTSPFC